MQILPLLIEHHWGFGRGAQVIFHFLHANIAAQQGSPGGSDAKKSTCNARDLCSIAGSGKFPGEGNGNPFQYPYLENSMDRGAWWAVVHSPWGCKESATTTERLHTHKHTHTRVSRTNLTVQVSRTNLTVQKQALTYTQTKGNGKGFSVISVLGKPSVRGEKIHRPILHSLM